VTLAIAGGILFATGLSGLGLSIYNTKSIYKLEEKVLDLETSIEEIKQNIVNEELQKKEMIKAINNLSHIITHNITHELNDLISDFKCIVGYIPYYVNKCITAISYIPLKTEIVNNAMTSGKVTPSYMSAKDIRALLTDKEYENSYYKYDLNLVYELAIFRKTSVTHSPFTITGFMLLPALFHQNVGYINEIHTVNFYYQDKNLVIDVPSYAVANDVQEYFWVPDMKLCIKTQSILVCPKIIQERERNNCLTTIFYHKEDNSTCQYTNNPKKLIKNSYIGDHLFLGAGHQNITAVKMISNKIEDLSSILQTPVLINISSYSNLKINGQHYSVYSRTINVTVPILEYNTTFVDIPIGHVSNFIPDLDIKMNSLESTQFIIHGINIPISIVVIISILYLYKKLLVADMKIRALSQHIQLVSVKKLEE